MFELDKKRIEKQMTQVEIENEIINFNKKFLLQYNLKDEDLTPVHLNQNISYIERGILRAELRDEFKVKVRGREVLIQFYKSIKNDFLSIGVLEV